MKCKTHKRYIGLSQPRAECLPCWLIYSRQVLKKAKSVFVKAAKRKFSGDEKQ